MLAVALPHAGLLQIGGRIGCTLRALHDAIGPAKGNHLRLAILESAEVDDCPLKCCDAFHVLRIRLFGWSVKYIIAQTWNSSRVRNRAPRSRWPLARRRGRRGLGRSAGTGQGSGKRQGYAWRIDGIHDTPPGCARFGRLKPAPPLYTSID